MLFPAVDKLLNIVSSKYELVHIIATRSKQMFNYKDYQLEDNEYKSSKNIGKSMEELEKGLIRVTSNNETTS